jgi:hypothetical protein
MRLWKHACPTTIDIRLNRQVAVKFLPEHAAKDPAALGRFEREAAIYGWPRLGSRRRA